MSRDDRKSLWGQLAALLMTLGVGVEVLIR